MTFSFGLYLKYFDAELDVNQFVGSLGCGPSGCAYMDVSALHPLINCS